MDYEKEYKEAFERAKKWYNAPNVDKIPTFGNRVIEEIFPELKESDDEKVRKEILEFFSQFENGELRGVDISSWIAYLKKQGEKGINGKNREIPFSEQKPAWSEGDDDNLSWLAQMLLGFDGNDIECYKDKKFIDKCKEVCKWLKAIKDRTFPQPKQEWSEEDERMYKAISIALSLKDVKGYLSSWHKTPDEAENWLKSLKDRYAWKPSDEQIEILDMVLTNESMDDNVARILRELREQLNKLREE